MPVTQYYLIGKITVPSSWLAFVLSFVITWLFIRIYFGKREGETAGNLFFYTVIIWKLSVILTDFQTVIRHPLSILYFHGGLFGWLLAVVTAGLLTIRQGMKEKWDADQKWALLLGLVTWQTAFQILMALLNAGSMVSKSGTVIAFLLFWLLTWWSYRKGRNSVSDLAVVWLAVHFMVSAIQGDIWNTALLTTLISALFLFGLQRLTEYPTHREEEAE